MLITNPVQRRIQAEFANNKEFKIRDCRDLADIFTPRRKHELNVSKMLADNFCADVGALTVPTNFSIINQQTCMLKNLSVKITFQDTRSGQSQTAANSPEPCSPIYISGAATPPQAEPDELQVDTEMHDAAQTEVHRG